LRIEAKNSYFQDQKFFTPLKSFSPHFFHLNQVVSQKLAIFMILWCIHHL